MLNPNFTILYVNSPAHSAAFYTHLLGIAPVESSATFAIFVTASGSKLGLWSHHSVEPVATALGGGGELAFALADEAAVDQLHRQWTEEGITILQQPLRMDFGYTFTASDPDGHRLRVYSPFPR